MKRYIRSSDSDIFNLGNWDRAIYVDRHNDIDPEILEVLAHDPANAVRRQVALHRNTPKSAVEELMQDESPIVALFAIESQNNGLSDKARYDAMCRMYQEWERAQAAREETPYEAIIFPLVKDICSSSYLTTDILNSIIEKIGWFILSEPLSANPITPPDVLRDIFNALDNGLIYDRESEEREIYLNLAKHPNTPPDVLELLTTCEASIARLARRNPNYVAPEE